MNKTIENLKKLKSFHNGSYGADIDKAIKALEQEPVLDKIRAEIEQITSRYSISKERGGMGQVEWSDRLIKESDVLQIIDKFKESEVEE